MKSTYFIGQVYCESLDNFSRSSFRDSQFYIKECLTFNPFIVGVAISPVHTDSKKDHFHLIVRAGSSISLSSLLKNSVLLPDNIPANHHFEVCADIKQASLYLCHIGFDNKVPYDPENCLLWNVPKVRNALLNAYDPSVIFEQILCEISFNDFFEVSDLLDYAFLHLPDYQVQYILKNFSKFDRYLCSRRWKQHNTPIVITQTE